MGSASESSATEKNFDGQVRESSIRLSRGFIATSAMCAALWTAFSSSAAAQTGTFVDRQNATDLRVATFNVYNDSILTGTRRTKFARIAAATKPDVWSFQEMYNTATADILTLLNAVQPAAPGRAWSVYRPAGDEHIIASQFAVDLSASNTTPAGYRAVAMSRINLPDAQFATDLYLMNGHFKCCGGFDPERQKQSDAFVNWMRDARTPGGSINLAPGTAMMIMGDFNLVDGPQPLQTVLDGNIINNATYGTDSSPDWDNSPNAQVLAYHNANPANPTWTWRSDNSGFAPGRLDYITYTDSVMSLSKSFVLNSMTMSAAELAATGLTAGDTTLTQSTGDYDHLPVIADFAGPLPGDLDADQDRDARDIDLLLATASTATNAGNWRADVKRDGSVIASPNTANSDADQLVRVLLDTEYGDTNLDRKVDFADLLTLAQHYENGSAGWADGSFDGNGVVSFDDLLTLAQHYGFGSLVNDGVIDGSTSQLSQTFLSEWTLARSLVPEPGIAMFIATAFTGGVRRRR